MQVSFSGLWMLVGNRARLVTQGDSVGAMDVVVTGTTTLHFLFDLAYLPRKWSPLSFEPKRNPHKSPSPPQDT
jgi:hypothetical protein